MSGWLWARAVSEALSSLNRPLHWIVIVLLLALLWALAAWASWEIHLWMHRTFGD